MDSCRVSEWREGKRERQVMSPLVLLIKFVLLLLIFQGSFSFSLLVTIGHQLATFARIWVAKNFLHLPWWPKWSQLEALTNNISSPGLCNWGGSWCWRDWLGCHTYRSSFWSRSTLCLNRWWLPWASTACWRCAARCGNLRLRELRWWRWCPKRLCHCIEFVINFCRVDYFCYFNCFGTRFPTNTANCLFLQNE